MLIQFVSTISHPTTKHKKKKTIWPSRTNTHTLYFDILLQCAVLLYLLLYVKYCFIITKVSNRLNLNTDIKSLTVCYCSCPHVYTYIYVCIIQIYLHILIYWLNLPYYIKAYSARAAYHFKTIPSIMFKCMTDTVFSRYNNTSNNYTIHFITFDGYNNLS